MATTKKPDEKKPDPSAIVKDIQNGLLETGEIILPEKEVLKELNLFQKLLIIQSMVEGFVKRGKGNNYTYVDGNQVLNTVRPLMNDLGLILKQEIVKVENQRYDYVTMGGKSKTEVLSLVDMVFTWVNCDTGERDLNNFSANGMNDFDKGVGSALTYGERYFLLKFFHVPTDADDIDASKRESAGPIVKKPAPVQVTQTDIKNSVKSATTPIIGSGTHPSPSAQAKDPTPDVPDDQKQWLNEKDPIYAKAMEKLYAGTTTIEKIAKTYKISKAMREVFKNQIGAGQENRFGSGTGIPQNS